ncbi:hypothetical protein [Streptomyces sp. NPDC005549]|uniref:hypothetical protein n=1 Tax=Streptomyces sp. NPDC005549 TaxID=3154888 RepID=UPI00339F6C2F
MTRQGVALPAELESVRPTFGAFSVAGYPDLRSGVETFVAFAQSGATVLEMGAPGGGEGLHRELHGGQRLPSARVTGGEVHGGELAVVDAQRHLVDWVRAAANPRIARVHWMRRLPVVKHRWRQAA